MPYFTNRGIVPLAGGLGLQTNLTSFWELNEASGTRVDSVVASGNDLTDNNTVTQAAGIGGAGNSAQFTAANNEFLSRASNAGLRVQDSTSFSINAWIYIDIVGIDKTIISKMSGDGTYRLRLDGSTRPQFDIFATDGTFSPSDTVAATTFGTLSTATWYMVALTVNKSGNIAISINAGTQDTTAFTATQVGGDTGTLEIGRNTNQGIDSCWDGRLQRVGYWKNRVLSASDITALYNGGAGLSYAAMA